MIDKITEIFGNVSNEDYKLFNDKINSIINFTRTTENVSRDFSWVPIVEETIPYLDTIIRNPKKFLQQEEDIVIVEKSKKISTETVRHLAQHTNFIQDVDDEGMVKPSKVLNVEKEDSWDLYENRFIYTLVKELASFVDKYAGKELENPKIETNSSLVYTATTNYENEDISVSINLESSKKQEPKDFDMDAMKKRITYIRDVVGDFENSAFIKSLSQAVPVKSPIKKTNIILKDPNFQKALALWEFIKNTEIGEPQDIKKDVKDLTTKELKSKIDMCSFLEYISTTDKTNDEDITAKSLASKILSLIDEYVDITELTEKKIQDFVHEEISSEIEKRKEKEKNIKEMYDKYIKECNAYINDLCEIM